MNTHPIFPDSFQYSRADFVSFTEQYEHNLSRLKQIVIDANDNQSFPLFLGRIKDNEFTVSPFHFTRIREAYPTYFIVDIPCDIEDAGPYKQQTIRFDNIVGDIPIVPGYEQKKLLEFGKNLSTYVAFQNEVRTYMEGYINENIALYYKNDDNTVSIIHTKLLEVNKSNFLGVDFQESFKSEATTTHESVSIKKHHRFISGNGFLFQVGPSWVTPNQHDDGCVFQTYSKELVSM